MHRERRKYKSAIIEVRRPLSKRESETVRMVAVCEFQVRWGATISAWLCILLGFLFAIVSYSPQTGEYTLALGRSLSFEGGFGGILVLSGALILWSNRPSVRLIFEGDKDDTSVVLGE